MCFLTPWPAGGALGFSSDVFIMDAVGGGDMNLGELADLTVANDNDLSMDVITLFVLDNAQDVQTHIQNRWNMMWSGT